LAFLIVVESFWILEKKATSEPEMSAELINRIRMTRLDKTSPTLEISSKRKGSTFEIKSSASGSAPNMFFVVIKNRLLHFILKCNSHLYLFVILFLEW